MSDAHGDMGCGAKTLTQAKAAVAALSTPSEPKPRHNLRNRGRYATSAPCDGCGKPCGTDPGTDDAVCGNGDGPGFFVCARNRCRKHRNSLGIAARAAHYTAQRERNFEAMEAYIGAECGS